MCFVYVCFGLFFNNVEVFIDIFSIYFLVFEVSLGQWEQFFQYQFIGVDFVIIKLVQFSIDIKFGGFVKVVVYIFLGNYVVDVVIVFCYVGYGFNLEGCIGYFVYNSRAGGEYLIFDVQVWFVIVIDVVVGVVLVVDGRIVYLECFEFWYFFFEYLFDVVLCNFGI